MKKSVEVKANQLKSMYVTESPVNFDDRHFGMKYFICFHNTHKIVDAFKTQKELEERIDDILENGVTENACAFF